jgi:hypothetical protein
MNAFRAKHTTGWKRRVLAVSVVATGAIALIPWGHIKSGNADSSDPSRIYADPSDTPLDTPSLAQPALPAIDRIPQVAFNSPVGGAFDRVGAKPPQVEQPIPSRDRLDAMGPRRRLIEPRQTERGPSAVSPRAPESSFFEVADGVYQVAGAPTASRESSNGDPVQDHSESPSGWQDPSLPLAEDSVWLDSAHENAVAMEDTRIALAIASNRDIARPAAAAAELPASRDTQPDAMANLAVTPEIQTGSPALASDNNKDSALDDVSESSTSVDVPPEAVTHIADVVGGPAITPKLPNINGGISSPNLDVPSPNAGVLPVHPDTPAFAKPGAVLNDGTAAVQPLDPARTQVHSPQNSLPVRLNDVWVGNLPYMVDSRDQLSVSLAGLLDLVRPSMRQDYFNLLKSSRAASGYVSFDVLRRAGFKVTFDSASDSLTLSADPAQNAPP